MREACSKCLWEGKKKMINKAQFEIVALFEGKDKCCLNNTNRCHLCTKKKFDGEEETLERIKREGKND